MNRPKNVKLRVVRGFVWDCDHGKDLTTPGQIIWVCENDAATLEGRGVAEAVFDGVPTETLNKDSYDLASDYELKDLAYKRGWSLISEFEIERMKFYFRLIDYYEEKDFNYLKQLCLEKGLIFAENLNKREVIAKLIAYDEVYKLLENETEDTLKVMSKSAGFDPKTVKDKILSVVARCTYYSKNDVKELTEICGKLSIPLDSDCKQKEIVIKIVQKIGS